jgi:hypothetical protein
MSAERGSLIYIAFFKTIKATISGGLGAEIKKNILLYPVAAGFRGVLLYTNGSSCFDKKTPWRSVGIG